MVLNKIKIKRNINNLAIDHLTLKFCFYYFNELYGINPLAQLTMLIYLLRFMHIKKLTLYILIAKRNYSTYNIFCKLLRNILQKYCRNKHVVICYYESSPCFIINLGEGINIIDKKYATINKFRVNYHRNYQLKNRIA